ncbi:hypothetical protein [Formosa sp. L2A11]|uniref:hypothetical protein n=1 Tax=Formosa sp. L2A11 TaxID=2686363 RepID=UPI00131C5014|nr:hypothetical protein [Formosa sp. L2A11]
MSEEKKSVGRPRKYDRAPDDVLIRRKMTGVLSNYFTSGQFVEDMELGKAGDKRMKIHLDLLPYVLSKKESIKSLVQGLDEKETDDLVKRIKAEIK